MSLDPAKQLGQTLGKLASEQSTIKENLSPDDTVEQLLLNNSENIIITGVFTAKKYTYAENSFVPDHIVLGYLDSTILELDGGYEENGLTMPVTMPITLGPGAAELLYTTTY